MFIRYAAPGASEDKRYEFRPDKILSSRAAIAEKLYSKAVGERRTWEQFVADAKQGGIAARRVVLWLVQSAQHHTLRYDDMPDLEVGQIGMEYSKQELRDMRPGIEESKEILEQEKQLMLTGLDQQIAEAEAGSDEPDPQPAIVEPEPALEPGKDDSNGEPSTS